MAHLDLSGGGVIGGTVPGIPTIIAGRTPYIGWGISASYADDQDLYAEELSKKDLSGYIEMYLPENQPMIKSSTFCNKYKLDWDKYGIFFE